MYGLGRLVRLLTPIGAIGVAIALIVFTYSWFAVKADRRAAESRAQAAPQTAPRTWTPTKDNPDPQGRAAVEAAVRATPPPSNAGVRLDSMAHAMVRLKKYMRNPDSLVIETQVANESGTVVCFVYRSQNGFGGMNRGYAYMDITYDEMHVDVDSSVEHKVCLEASYGPGE
jgi:hypothetical protein